MYKKKNAKKNIKYYYKALNLVVAICKQSFHKLLKNKDLNKNWYNNRA